MSAGEFVAAELGQYLDSVRLIDHHVHGAFRSEVDRPEFEVFLNEGSPDLVPGWMTQFDSQVGFAIRRWCSPVLGLARHCPADQYWARRCALGVDEVTSRFLRAAGVSDWLIDTGLGADTLLDPAGMASFSGARVHQIVRLESLAEVLASEKVTGGRYPDLFRSRLATLAQDAVGVKTILAYRSGFDIDWTRPPDSEVCRAATRWIDSIGSARPRVTDPVLLRFGVHAAVDLGLPIQIHTGFGDRDLKLDKANPILITEFLRLPEVSRIPVLLLHSYPYHREAGYLAQAFGNVYFDVGLALNHVGVRSVEIAAESFEVAPFAKQLYSSDACGPPELHYLGAVLWRQALKTIIGRWVDDGDWSPADAIRVIEMVGRRNAERVYALG